MNLSPNRFVIVCHARTGSSLLGSLLAAHPQVAWEDERYKALQQNARRSTWSNFVHKTAYHFPVVYLNWRAFANHRFAYGCKFMPFFVANFERAIRSLHITGWRFIYLQRRDIMEGAISTSFAAAARHWITRTNRPAPNITPMHIDPEDFLEKLRLRLGFETLEGRIFAKIPHLKLVYEDDLLDPDCWQGSVRRVFDFLDLPTAQVKPVVHKTWERPYTEMITNYTELIEVVRGSDLAYVLQSFKGAGAQPPQAGSETGV